MMRAILAIPLALSLFGYGPSVQASRAHGAALVAACADDGRAGATAGTGLYAAQRATWAVPPTCFVPDVDYNVGADCVNIVCASPTTASGDWSYNGTSHSLRCDGGTNSVLQNIDFRLVGGGGIDVVSCAGVTIRNVYVTFSCTAQGIVSEGASSNVTLTGVTMDGLDLVAPGGCNSSDFGELINLKNTGLQKIVYTRVLNATQHSISHTCNAPFGTATAYDRYNSISRAGNQQGGHANGDEWVNGTTTPGDPPCNYTSSDVQYNYFYNPQPDTPLETGVLTLDTTISSTAATLHFTGAAYGQTSLISGMSLTSANLQSGTTFTLTTAGPTIAITLSKTATATASGVSAAIPNAYPFGIFQAIRYVTQNTASGSLFNGNLANNVFDGVGPIKGYVYTIGCSNSAGGPNNDVVYINGNFLQPAGATAIYTGAGVGDLPCTRLSGTGNKDLATGGTITVP